MRQVQIARRDVGPAGTRRAFRARFSCRRRATTRIASAGRTVRTSNPPTSNRCAAGSARPRERCTRPSGRLSICCWTRSRTYAACLLALGPGDQAIRVAQISRGREEVDCTRPPRFHLRRSKRAHLPIQATEVGEEREEDDLSTARPGVTFVRRFRRCDGQAMWCGEAQPAEHRPEPARPAPIAVQWRAAPVEPTATRRLPWST